MASNKYKLFVSLAWGQSYIKGKGNSKECTVRWCIGLSSKTTRESVARQRAQWGKIRSGKVFEFYLKPRTKAVKGLGIH